MVDVAEQNINQLRQTVDDLQKSVNDLLQCDTTVDDFETKRRTADELITQALLNVDNIEISKEAAVEAMRNGDRSTSQKIAVLLSRRKNLVKRLNQLGDQVKKESDDTGS